MSPVTSAPRLLSKLKISLEQQCYAVMGSVWYCVCHSEFLAGLEEHKT